MQETFNEILNLSADQSEDALRRVISRLHEDAMAEVRYVAVKNGDRWVNGITVIRAACPTRSEIDPVAYRNVLLGREVFPAAGILDWHHRMASGVIHYEPVDIHYEDSPVLRRQAQLCGNNRLSDRPGHFFASNLSTRFQPKSHPLLATRAPYYPSPSDAAAAWTETDGPDTAYRRWGEVCVFVPETRARLSDLHREGNYLHGEVEATDPVRATLWIKGAFRVGSSWHGFEHEFRKGPLSVPIPEGALHLDLYLIGSSDHVFDLHKEGPRYSIGLPGAVFEGVDSGAASSVRDLIEGGEGEATEFKAWVKPGDDKESEIVATAIAFANTRGGRILIGVTDRCVLKGIDRDLRRCWPDISLEEAKEKYVRALRQLLAQSLTPGLDLTVEASVVDGRTVVQVEVPACPQPPCSNPRNKQTFVRRGANNMVPDPQTDWARLLNRGGGHLPNRGLSGIG